MKSCLNKTVKTNNKTQGFSLIEVMTSLLIISVMIAATTPIITKNLTAKPTESIWKYTPNETDIYYSEISDNQKAGIATGSSGVDYKLKIGSYTSTQDNSIVVIGSGVSPAAPSGAGKRFTWLSEKMALRAGYVDSTQWDDANLGLYSVAYGKNTIASGEKSSVLGGESNSATATNSVVIGGNANSNAGEMSFLGGGNTCYIEATASHSFVGGGAGNNIRAGYQYSAVAGGQSNPVFGNYSAVGGGVENLTRGDYSAIGGGRFNYINASNSLVAGGYQNKAYADNSWAGGLHMNVPSTATGTFVWGRIGITDLASYIPVTSAPFTASPFTDPDRFILWGNNTDTNDTLYVQGKAEITGTLTVGGYNLDSATGAWAVSDRRLKNIIGPYTKGLHEISQLKTYNYTYKKDKKKNIVAGVIAQDLEKVLPQAVRHDKKYLMINQDPIFYAMVNSLKELGAENRALEQKLENIKKRIRALKEVEQE